MQTYIAILRGINVSGQKVMKMEALRNLCASLGFTNSQTYIQSGNIVFQFKKSNTADLEKKLARGIVQEFGFEVPIMVKELEELIAVSKNNVFLSKEFVDSSKLHVTFLSNNPERTEVEKIKTGNYASDEFALLGKTVYLYCPNGYGNTKLSNSFFENKWKVTATTRNWKTVNELIRIAENCK